MLHPHRLRIAFEDLQAVIIPAAGSSFATADRLYWAPQRTINRVGAKHTEQEVVIASRVARHLHVLLLLALAHRTTAVVKNRRTETEASDTTCNLMAAGRRHLRWRRESDRRCQG